MAAAATVVVIEPGERIEPEHPAEIGGPPVNRTTETPLERLPHSSGEARVMKNPNQLLGRRVPVIRTTQARSGRLGEVIGVAA